MHMVPQQQRLWAVSYQLSGPELPPCGTAAVPPAASTSAPATTQQKHAGPISLFGLTRCIVTVLLLCCLARVEAMFGHAADGVQQVQLCHAVLDMQCPSYRLFLGP
jgi:hypothetical protein